MERMRQRYEVCVYHTDTPDGFAGAWVAWMGLGDELLCLPMTTGAPVDLRPLRDRCVLAVGPRWDAATLEAAMRSAGYLAVLDHRAAAQRVLAGLEHPHLGAHFDSGCSTAMLVWRHIFGARRPPPPLLEHVEDVELGRMALAGTEEVCLALSFRPRDFATWSSLTVPQMKQEGRAVRRWLDTQIEPLLRGARRMDLSGVAVPCVNAPESFADRLGARLAEDAPFAFVWEERAGTIVFHLRSRRGGAAVNRIAEQFGGHGTRHAATFTLPVGAPLAARLLGLTAAPGAAPPRG